MKSTAKEMCGKTLRAMRVSRGLTQNDVAVELGYTTAQFISNWERGISYPPMEAITTLVKVFKVRPTNLIEAIFASKQAVLEEERSLWLAAFRGKK